MKLETMLWGPPHARANRTNCRKPLAIWKERMARMGHKAQFRRWRVKPVTTAQYEETKRVITAGTVESFVGFAFVQTKAL